MKVKDEDVVPMANLYREGHTLKELKKQFGYSAPTIAKSIKSQGVEIRSVGRKKRPKGKPLFDKKMKSFGKQLSEEEAKEVRERIFGPTGN